MEAPGLADALYLVSQGVPYDVAMHLPPRRRMAYVAIMGTYQGGNWNWRDLRFEKPQI